MDALVHNPLVPPKEDETDQVPGAAVMRGAAPSEPKSNRSVEDIMRIMGGDRAPKKGESNAENLMRIMRGGAGKKAKAKTTLSFTDKLFQESVGAVLTAADLVVNPALASASGLYGLGRLALGDDPDDVAKKMAKWHVDIAGSMEGAGDIQDIEKRNMQVADKVFGVFRPVAESFGKSMLKPQPVYDEDGNVVAMAKPIPVWATAIGHAGIEIGPWLLAGELAPKGFRAGKAKYRRGKMGKALASDKIDAAAMSTASKVDVAKNKARTAKEIMSEAETKLAQQGETPLPEPEVTQGPTYIEAKTGTEIDFSRPRPGEKPAPATKSRIPEDVVHDPQKARRIRDQKADAARRTGTKLYSGGVYDAVGKKAKSMGRGLKNIWDEATKEQIANNASGESAASLEAIRRLAQQEDMLFFRVDQRKPNVIEPIAMTVDTVDLVAGNNKVILAKKIGDPRLMVMDSCKNMNRKAVSRTVENLQRKAAKASLSDYAMDTLFANGGYEMAAGAMKDTLRKLTDNKVVNAVEDAFYIEPRFERLGAPETAFHMKNTHSYASSVMREGAAKLIEQAEKVGYDPKVLKDAVLIAESKQMLIDHAGTPAGDMAAWMRREFDNALKRLNDEGVNVNFKERMTKKASQKLKDAIEFRKANDTNAARLEVVKWREALTKLEDFEFVSIPKNMWFETLMDSPKSTKKALRILNAKERRILSIGEMEKFLGDKISAMDVMGNYFHKLGNDLSIARVLKAAIDEGMATKKKALGRELGFERISATDAPAFSDVYMHPTLRATLQKEFIARVNPSAINQVTSLTKMMTFDSPWFLGYYNMIQSSWLRGPHHIPGIIYDAIKARKMIKSMHPEFRLALENGLQSTPYPQPFETTIKSVENMHKGLAKNALEVITENTPKKMLHKAVHGKKLGRLPVVPEAYGLLWDMAWESFDLPVRMGTYNWLRKKGMSPRQSAQTAALYHGDYAAVPRSTRVMLNKALYTPTFKIAMAKLHGKMLRGALPELLGKPKGMNQVMGRGMAAKGAFYWWSTNQLFDTWLTHGLGFKQESWGRRYSKQVETDKGPKDLTVTLAHPMNLLPKYGEKLAKIWDKGSPGATMRAFTQLKYDMTPLLTIAMGALQNRTYGGQAITNTYDDNSTKAKKVAWYGVQQVSSWAVKAFPDGETKAVKKAFANEVGFGLALLLDSVSNQYLAAQKDQRLMWDLGRMKQNINRDIMKEVEKGTLDKEKFNELINNFMEHLNNKIK